MPRAWVRPGSRAAWRSCRCPEARRTPSRLQARSLLEWHPVGSRRPVAEPRVQQGTAASAPNRARTGTDIPFLWKSPSWNGFAPNFKDKAFRAEGRSKRSPRGSLRLTRVSGQEHDSAGSNCRGTTVAPGNQAGPARQPRTPFPGSSGSGTLPEAGMRGWKLTNSGLLAGRWPRDSRCALSA